MPVQRLRRKPVNDVVLRLSSKQKTFSLGSAEEQPFIFQDKSKGSRNVLFDITQVK